MQRLSRPVRAQHEESLSVEIYHYDDIHVIVTRASFSRHIGERAFAQLLFAVASDTASKPYRDKDENGEMNERRLNSECMQMQGCEW